MLRDETPRFAHIPVATFALGTKATIEMPSFMNESNLSERNRKKEWFFWMAVLVAFIALSHFEQVWGAPTVTNVVASQRAGTTLVDISYDVATTTPPVFVKVAVSDDGGATYSTVAITCTGDVESWGGISSKRVWVA